MTAADLLRPRKTLSRKQKAYVFERDDGICHLCGRKIDGLKEKWDADHVIPRGITGKDDLAEFKPAHVDCHKVKTKTDVKVIAKCNRLRADRLGVPKAKSRPVPGSKNSPWKAKYNKQTGRFETVPRDEQR